MATRAIEKLAAGWTAGHAADQMLLAWIPLFLVSAGATPVTVGLVVAAHATAWLLVSLPVGVFADALSRRTIMMLGGVAIICASGLGVVAAWLGQLGALALAGIAFLAASGVVAIALSVFALVPGAAARAGLARANAMLEFARAAVCIAAPLAAAWLVARNASVIFFGVVALAGCAALASASALKPESDARVSGTSLLQSIREGASFVARQPLLRAIALCAVAWNSGFFALTAVLAPFALERLTMGVPDIGRAWAVYGAGLLLGAACAPAMIARLHVGFMMCFGPLVSAIGMLGMVAPAAHRGAMAAYVALFCLGFGPMTWLVLQTSVRQLVTPQALLGRVGAVITTAIYGVRPLGALAASATAALAGADYAIWLAMGLFCLSALAVLLSPATRLGRLDRDLSRADR